ncbi:MAG: aspartate/glutamate racemase family protein, partial [Treponema sp.]|nr:aspartate/glutamate racemase family protein [Treponema sp.]
RLEAVKPAVNFFREQNCDVIVLACTHFLNMADYIQKVAGSQIKVIDSREGVVKRALAVGLNNLNDFASKNQNKPLLFVSGFTQSNDFNTYSNFCQNIGITFGGYID